MELREKIARVVDPSIWGVIDKIMTGTLDDETKRYAKATTGKESLVIADRLIEAGLIHDKEG